VAASAIGTARKFVYMCTYCVAVCCSVLQCVAVRCNVAASAIAQAYTLIFIQIYIYILCCGVLQCVAVFGSVLQCFAVYRSVLHNQYSH